MKAVVFSVLPLLIAAFRVPAPALFHQSRLFSDQSNGATNTDVFTSTPSPVAVSESDGDIKVDFEALSKESAANTFKTKTDLSEL